MSWLGRLFSSTPAPPANSVVIPDDIAAALGGDAPLQARVEEALRDLLEIRRRAAEHDSEGLPFWLQRDSEQKTEIDQSLRDKVTHRRAAENDD